MVRLLLLSLLVFSTSPARAIYKCESGGSITYSDEPCREGRTLGFTAPTRVAPRAADEADARRRAERDKSRLEQIETRRESERLAAEEKHAMAEQRGARAKAIKKHKCEALAQQRQWGDEDAAKAPAGSMEKAQRIARRNAEKYAAVCGK
ncbi:MAG: hypothetical protein JWQ23_2738 [Herminiimonas sp.]|jgi:hypothetical protein|nr:hypothetical protein [Herminiimonas sp.]